jgi:hypothetical protein
MSSEVFQASLAPDNYSNANLCLLLSGHLIILNPRGGKPGITASQSILISTFVTAGLDSGSL